MARRSSSAVRKPQSPPADAFPQEAGRLALSAFMRLSRPAAFVDAAGRIVLTNPQFDTTFAQCRDLIADINREALQNAGRVARQASIPDGRTFMFESTVLDQGWGLGALEITGRLLLERTDHVTGFANRLALRERLAERVADPRMRERTAVLCLDLHRFKGINMSLGRDVGDALLRIVASRIRSVVNDGDVVGRLDADRFAVLQLSAGQPRSAIHLATQLLEFVNRPYLLEGQLIHATASLGVAPAGADSVDADRLFHNAELALSRAKTGCPGHFHIFEEGMGVSLQERRTLEIDLRRALALREFSLEYQPQYNFARGEIVGFEALLRWRSPTRGAVSPLDFIPLAEETGLITPIGEWVIRTACREAMTWPGRPRIAVNVSAVQFSSPNLAAVVLAALAESGLEPDRLELEITESVLLDRNGTAESTLQSLRKLGVRVALDDFGTGYSSLGYLASFPFDKIKIDQSFVRGERNDTVGQAIVRAIAMLGSSLGMSTVAEGVETLEQLQRLRSDGCTDVQGYLISRPVPSDAVPAVLDAQRGSLSAPREI